MVDLHFGAGGAAAYEVDGLGGVRVVQCAGLDHTGTGVFVGDVGEVAGEYVVACVAAVAVGVGGAECEGIAVVAVCALVVVYGELVQVLAAEPVAVYPPVILAASDLTCGSSRPMVMPIAAAMTMRISTRSIGAEALKRRLKWALRRAVNQA